LTVDREEVSLIGYNVAARKDRSDGRIGGGVIVFVRDDLRCVAQLDVATVAERVWLTVHTDHGPFLLGLWYRPPDSGADSIISLATEHDVLSQDAFGTILVGDMNVHQKSWLTFSNADTVEGKLLQNVSLDRGWREFVRKPTRDDHLLDLVLSDLAQGVSTKVLPKIADHNVVIVSVNFTVPQTAIVERGMWHFKSADWIGLNKAFGAVKWKDVLDWSSPAVVVESLNAVILKLSKRFIKFKVSTVQKRTHEYLNEKCLEAIQKKVDAAGTQNEANEAQKCSEVLLSAFRGWQDKMRKVLEALPKGSKKWWTLTKTLMDRKTQCSSIPPLKKGKEYILDPKGKAELFAETWKAKCVLPDSVSEVIEDHHFVPPAGIPTLGEFLPLRMRTAVKVLAGLDESKATGPDGIPSIILKRCARTLCLPIILLARLIIDTSEWPWQWHWLAPVYKKKSVSNPGNYRGVHLTAHLGKSVER